MNSVACLWDNRNTLHRACAKTALGENAGPAASGLALISVDFGRFGAGTSVLGLPVAAAARLANSARR